MAGSTQELQPNYVELTADIVSAYLSNNSIPVASLGELLSTVHAALSGLAKEPTSAPAPTVVESATAREIKRSITPDFLISFVDGKRYKTLRRHLNQHGLTPDTYRERYGLPSTYPMVSPGYSAQRSELARSSGLGQQRRKSNQAATAEASPAPEKAKRVGRPRKAATA